jgi:hypothetical protein
MTAIIISAIFAIAFYFHPLYAGVFAATLAAIAVVLRAIAGDRDDFGHDAKNREIGVRSWRGRQWRSHRLGVGPRSSGDLARPERLRY